MNIKAVLGLLALAVWPVLAAEPLPAPWQHQDIGAVQLPGTAEVAGGVLVLQGTLDIWGVADGCHIAWQPVHGDGVLLVRVVAMDNPGGVAHAKAGLCLRESLEAGARHVTLCTTPTDGAQFLYREVANGKTTRFRAEAGEQKAAVAKGQFPCWLKLVRHGNEFSGFESADGATWQPTGRVTLELPGAALAGLTASSHKTNILTKAKFDHVDFSLTPAEKKTDKRP